MLEKPIAPRLKALGNGVGADFVGVVGARWEWQFCWFLIENKLVHNPVELIFGAELCRLTCTFARWEPRSVGDWLGKRLGCAHALAQLEQVRNVGLVAKAILAGKIGEEIDASRQAALGLARNVLERRIVGFEWVGFASRKGIEEPGIGAGWDRRRIGDLCRKGGGEGTGCDQGLARTETKYHLVADAGDCDEIVPAFEMGDAVRVERSAAPFEEIVKVQAFLLYRFGAGKGKAQWRSVGIELEQDLVIFVWIRGS